MIKDEKGLFFAFGPWWFVIIVMIISIVAGLFKQNNSPKKNVHTINDYIPPEKSVNAQLSKNICPQCGKINNRNAKFCIECATPLIKDLKISCPVCGMKNPSEAKYCQECGAKI
jgi:predicted amidophosphoribosyltransferase